NSDVDYWSFSGRAGQRVLVVVQNPGNPGSSGLNWRVERPDGGDLINFSAPSSGAGQSSPATLPVDGTYYVRVGVNYNYYGEYRFRVLLLPAQWQLENESNNAINQANALSLVLAAGVRRAQVTGVIHAGDTSGDFFQLGNLGEGIEVRLEQHWPASSGLVSELAIIDSTGAVVVAAAAGTQTLTHNIGPGQAGAYYARVNGTPRDLFSHYLLSVELEDTVPPVILADTLPAEGTTITSVFDRFTLTFSEDMLAATVNSSGSYDLRSAGLDGVFDTTDDVIWTVVTSPSYSSGLNATYRTLPGLLQPGSYRFIATTALQDSAGNSMNVERVRHFSVAQLPGFQTESEPNNTAAQATALPMESTQPSLISGAGRGYLDGGSDLDFWSFEAQAGDVMVLAVQNPGNPGNSSLIFQIHRPDGTLLQQFTAPNNGLGQTDPIALTESGLYTIRVAPNYGYYNEHRLRVSLYRDGLATEGEANNSIATANSLTFVTEGTTRTASIGGYIRLSSDLDYFNLGTIEAGSTVFIRTRQPASSLLAPVVSLYDVGNNYMSEAGAGRPFDGVAEIEIIQTGTYYALVRAGADSAGLMSEYLLDALVLPTEDVIFPNLQVTQLTIPVTVGLESGDPLSFSFTVENVGSLATQADTWYDRVVLSPNTTMDADDIELGFYQHTGVLQPGQGYTVPDTVNLPDGISGNYYLIVKTDFTDTVNEFLLEGDNETATENPLAIALADYPDLVIENLNLTGPDAGQMYTLAWDTFNRGTAATITGFTERVRVRNQTTATTLFDQTYTNSGLLAVNASVARQAGFSTSTPGTYLVEVTTDSGQAIFEYDAISHQSAENNTVTTTFAITAFYTLTLNSIPPGAGALTGAGTYPDGTSINVTATPVTNAAPYYFVHWTEANVVRSANSNYTFILNRNQSLNAEFALPWFEITASNHPPAAGVVVGTGFHIWGTTNTLTAQPAFGYQFSHWTENGVTVGSNPTLVTIVSSNRFVVANYAEAHLVHQVTTATLPAGLATVTGTGTYNNGQSTVISTPSAVTNTPPNYYAFKRFTLNGAPYQTNASFLETFATTDPTNMHFVAEYELVDATPPVITAVSNSPGVTTAVITWTTDEPATSRVEYGLTSSYTATNSSALLRTQHSLMLSGLAPATLYHFRVRSADAAGNATTSGDFTLTTLTPPDLTVGALTAPATAPAGTTIPLTFVISNIGPGTAFGPWQNAVLLSPNANGSGAQTLGAVSFNPGPAGLGAGASITATQNVIVPALPPGARYLGLRVDSANQLFELDEDNNTAFAVSPLNIVAIDLRVSRVTAPATAEFGQTVPVEVVVTNAGSAPASFAWTDRLYWSPTSNTLATLLNTFDAAVIPLLPGASYTNTANVTLPHTGASTPGVYHLVLAADHGNAIAESNENNNLGSAAITLSLPPMPDFAVVNVLAPTNAAPGETLPLIWTTTNQGPTGITGVWSETVFLATNSAGAGLQELATHLVTNTLAAGGAITRTQAVTIPTSGVLGNLWFAVQADSRGDVIELSEANNLGVATNSTLVPAVLTLQLNLSQITEGASQPVVATVTRNGSRAAALTVTLINGDPTEVSLPAQVIIAAGQASASFNIVALADGEVDGSQVVTIGASAPGFESAAANLTVLDADLPQLSLIPFTDQILEGEAIAALVMRNGGTNAAVQVAVNSSSPGQLSVVSPVTIPAGEYFTHTEIRALDDTLVEAPLGVTVTVSTPGYHPGATNITILDNDWPTLTLAIAPDTLSEGAGPQAAMATLTRAPVSARPLEVELRSSNTNALRVPSLVTIPGGTTVITFPVATVNNDLVDGDKNVEVRAWFRASGSANRLGEALIVPVTVTDDDGPTLRVAFSQNLVAEGLNPAAIGTVTRNAGTNAALLVTLVSSDPSELTVPPTVTIPAGAFSAQFNAASVADGETDGNQTVTVTASAAGLTAGAAQITVSDINLPDLVVVGITVPATAATEEFVDIGYQIRNQGVVASPSNAIVQRIYLSPDPFVGDDILISQLSLNVSLPAGSQFGQSFAARLPQAAGNYWVIVETDVLNNVLEIIENNNVGISPNPIQVVPAYEAVVATTLENAPANTPVTMTGHATRPGGLPAQFALVNIHINVRGTTRVIAALTDVVGNFATTWQPLPGEAGYYEIAASHPGATAPAAQDSFSLLGMKAQPAQPSVRLSEGSSIGGSVAIENLSDVPLTGLAVEALNLPANVNAMLTLETNYLAGSAVVQLGYGISALNATFTSGVIGARITSAEGAVLEVPIRVTIDPLVPRLVAYPDRLDGGMKRGAQRTVSFEIAHTGGLETGTIAVSLPPLPWMSLVSPNPMPSLAPGETNRVTLQLSPPEDISLTIHQGNLAVNGDGTGVAVPFSFRALSEAKGDLLITSVNEFTYYGAGSPPLTNATVRVRDAVSRSVVTNGVTDASGRFFVPQLMEGYYDLELDAEQHNGYHSTIFVEPGITNDVTAFLSYQAVRYTWTVERIEIEDHYRITIETEFETVVPAPVVTIDPPVLDVSDLKIVGQTKQVNMTFRNHGLIAADDVQLRFSSHPFYSIEPLIGDLGRLPAKSSLTIPVTLRRIGDFPSPAPGQVRAASGVPCGMSGNTLWSFVCGPFIISGGTSVPVSGVSGDCGGAPSAGPGGVGFGPGWSGPGGPGSSAYSSYSIPSIGISLGCGPAGAPPEISAAGGDDEEGEDGGVCARVKLKLDQEAVLSREAFRATLDIDNATATLEDIRIIVRVTDGQGNNADDLFGLQPPELTGLSDVDGGGSVAAGAKGTARWTLVPTVDAAPPEPVQYFVGGEFRYTLNGLVVTVPHSPVPITVNPTARLTLDYFHQRDVYSDDPFTDVVEPSIPFNLAIMVRNWGAGEAKNFRITSAQPEIIENEKGLLIDFKIIATEVAGQNLTPSLTANFGTIPPGGISVARWLMTSTLQGLFINYSATFEHLDGQGNPRLSLIDEVRIHEMIRLVHARGPFEDGKPDFLVNNKPDLRDLPDTLWLSDGSSNYVAVVTNAVITGTLSPGNLQVQMTADMPAGWTYLRIPDPADGQYRLAQVIRSDSFSVGVETNAWVTDRTFLGQGKRPKQENILHLLDHDSTGQYTLLYELLPTVDNEPPVSSVAALPGQSQAVFLLNWSGQDNAGGSGIASYDVYFSEDGGAFQRWLAGTPTTSAVFQGTLNKSYAFYSVAVDNAGNRETAPAAPQAQTTVAFVNQPPVLAAIPTQVIPEGETFSLTLSATDPDGDSLTYQLGTGAPGGMVLNAQSGLLTWITAELHGPSTNQITVTARDSGIPQLSDTLTFSLIVLESNTPPVLAPIPNFTIAEGALLTFTNAASDVDLPAQQLTFSLGAGAPAGAAVHPVSGVFTWQPNQTQGGVTNLISVIVTDDGPPSMSATQTFAVIVIDTQPDFSLGIGTTAIWSNGVGNVALTLQSGIDLNQLQLVLAVGGGRLTNLNLSGLAPQIGSANLIPLGADRFNVQFDKQSGALLQGNLTLGQLGFAAVPHESSAIAELRGESLQGVRADSLQTVDGQAGLGRVFIVGREPILDAAPAGAGEVALTLYGHPGKVYTLEHTTGLGGAISWGFDSLVTATGLRTDLPLRPASGPIKFFRALEGTVGVTLTIRLEGGQVVLEWPLECAECVLEQSPALTGPAAVWTNTPGQPTVVNGRYRVALPVSGERLYLRLAMPRP
ncbi:MAG: pre-peptidase C-terminal domain-containing protein, partial [Verrucomicrobia bacterium]|nr:pre-peptidase C-terminal domain-containing protein [Verrucomicrobiota bacterium]